MGSASTLPLPSMFVGAVDAFICMFVEVDWSFDDGPPPHAAAIASSETAMADRVRLS